MAIVFVEGKDIAHNSLSQPPHILQPPQVSSTRMRHTLAIGKVSGVAQTICDLHYPWLFLAALVNDFPHKYFAVYGAYPPTPHRDLPRHSPFVEYVYCSALYSAVVSQSMSILHGYC